MRCEDSAKTITIAYPERMIETLENLDGGTLTHFETLKMRPKRPSSWYLRCSRIKCCTTITYGL